MFRKPIAETKNAAPECPDVWQQLPRKVRTSGRGKKEQEKGEGEGKEGSAEESTEEAER